MHTVAASQDYEQKAPSYYGAVRTEVLPFLPDHVNDLLEVGCGDGGTLGYLRSIGRVERAVGLELFPSAAQAARAHADLVIEGDIETIELDLELGSFDAILCLDVLEHLIDPWATVRKLSELLRPGGVLVASIPNVRHASLLAQLVLRGRWDYAESGLLDRTHLRFFTRATATELLESSGLRLDRWGATGAIATRLWVRVLNRLTFSVFREFVDYQYVLRARKPEN